MVKTAYSTRARWLVAALAIMLSAGSDAAAAGDTFDRAVAGLFPDATRVGLLEGQPPSAPIYHDEKTIGYVFLTDQVQPIPGYSGEPISALVGFDTGGKVRGVRVLKHHEPILAVGVEASEIEAFVEQYKGLSVKDRTHVGKAVDPNTKAIDGLSGATITSMVLDASIMRSLRKVAAARGLFAGGRAAEAEPSPRDEIHAVLERRWYEQRYIIGVLIVGLLALTIVLFFQDWFAKRPRVLSAVRNGFIAFTIVFIGWIALGQLSVVNVLTFLHSVMSGFQWETFLVDPVLFVLWSYVAVVLLLWGRGVYCGWLCPYGNLQELVQKISRRLRLPQLEFPDVVHERLWAVKYIIFLVLLGLSMESLSTVQPYTEVEPFKTTFTLHFDRSWPFIVYAIGMVAVSAFNRKFFCKYVCPLGAALAIPAKLKLFDWLRRRSECGHPCQICGNECEIRAVHADGVINVHECHHCLDCQVTYWDTQKCPPLVQREKRRQRHRKSGQAVPVPDPKTHPTGQNDGVLDSDQG